MFTIYQVTNTINRKSYIGFTTEDPPRNRWVAHQYLSRKGSRTHQEIDGWLTNTYLEKAR